MGPGHRDYPFGVSRTTRSPVRSVQGVREREDEDCYPFCSIWWGGHGVIMVGSTPRSESDIFARLSCLPNSLEDESACAGLRLGPEITMYTRVIIRVVVVFINPVNPISPTLAM